VATASVESDAPAVAKPVVAAKTAVLKPVAPKPVVLKPAAAKGNRLVAKKVVAKRVVGKTRRGSGVDAANRRVFARLAAEHRAALAKGHRAETKVAKKGKAGGKSGVTP
jgi:hypothetical protein